MSTYNEAKLIRGFDIKELSLTESEESSLYHLFTEKKNSLNYVSEISAGKEYHIEGHTSIIGFKNDYEAGDKSTTTREAIDLEEHMEWTNDYMEEFKEELTLLIQEVTENKVIIPDLKWLLVYYEY